MLRVQRNFFNCFIHTLQEILFYAIRKQDIKTIKTLYNRLAPDEIFSYCFPEKIKELIVINSINNNQKVNNPLNKILEIFENYGILYIKFLVIQISYILEGFLLDEFDQIFVKELFLETKNTINKSDIYYSEYPFIIGQKTTTEFSERFNRFPDTQIMISLEDERKIILFFCLNGIVDIPNVSLYPSSFQNENLVKKISAICSEIQKDFKKWSYVLDLSPEKIQTNADIFSRHIRTLFAEYVKAESKKLADASLDSERIDSFKEKLIFEFDLSYSLKKRFSF